MRNLKRALSLALASVMLLGMMMIGTSAASIDDFNDSDAIQNQEAVTLTAGLGIFEGRTNGDFDPTAPVSRAEMAVIICKILHGADVAPSNFTGVKNFSDVPTWAEGYVNMCSSLGIIAGRGNGIFDPDATVTTVEASTMLLKALGYYRGEDVLGADWKLTVTSRATQAGVVKDMKLDVDAPLTRDNVAQMTYNTLFAQMVAYDNGRTLYVKNTDRNTVVTASTEDDANTLAYHTFHLWTVEGIVVANGYTDKAFMETSRSSARTQIMFTEPTDLNQDGRAEMQEEDVYDFEYATDLDLIGHNVKVYYQKDGRDYKVFTMFDKATLVAYINYNTSTTKLADNANNAGFQKDTILNFGDDAASGDYDYIVNYDWDVRYNDAGVPSTFIEPLDQLLVISNSDNKKVDVVIALDQRLDTVKSIEEFRDEMDYEMTVEDGTENIPWKWDTDIEEGDYVISTAIGRDDDIVVFQPADIRTGDLSRITGTSHSDTPDKALTFEGTVYKKSNVFDSNTNATINDDIVRFRDVSDIGEVTLAFDEHGKIIAQIKKSGPSDYAYVAQFGFRHTTSGLATAEDELTALVYKADGTSKIYVVDKDKSNAIPANLKDNIDHFTGTTDAQILNGSKSRVDGTAINELHRADGGYKGVYKVEYKSNDTKIVLKSSTMDLKATRSPAHDLFSNNASASSVNTTHLIKGHSTFVKGPLNTGSANVKYGTYALMNDTNTLFFYVTGSYNDKNTETLTPTTTSKNTLNVRVVESIKNVTTVDNLTLAAYPGVNDQTITYRAAADTIPFKGVVQAVGDKFTGNNKVSDVTNRVAVGAVLVQAVAMDGTDVYYFNKEYSVTRTEGGYAVEYTLYENATGDAYTVTYNDSNGTPFATSEEARNHAKSIFTGFYTLGANKMNAYATASDPNGDGNPDPDEDYQATKKGDSYYVVKDVAQYDEATDNLFSNNFYLGSITENVKVVDTCDSGLTSVSRIVRAVKTLQGNGANPKDLQVSYSVDKNYNTAVLFVAYYNPDGIKAPGSVSGNLFFKNSLTATQSGNNLDLTGFVYTNNSDTDAFFADGVDADGVTATYQITVNVLGGLQSFTRTITTKGTATVAPGTGAITDTIPNVPYLNSNLATYEIEITWKWDDGVNNLPKVASTTLYY